MQTINKNANELFDYESKEYLTENFVTNKECYIFKSDCLRFSSTPEKPNNKNSISSIGSEEELVAHISCNQNYFVLERKYLGVTLKGKAWLPVKLLSSSINIDQVRKLDSINTSNQDNANNGQGRYIINQGDILKFGRVEMKVRTIHLEGKNSEAVTTVLKNCFNSTTVNNPSVRTKTTIAKKICRICFGEEENESPLINPCKCSGGVKYVHLNCLQHWLKTKGILRSSTNENCMTLTYKKVDCEICKSILPDIVQNGDKFYEVWNFFDLKFKNYVIFETLLPDSPMSISGPNKYKTVYIVNFSSKNVLRIGRSHEADLRIKDVSVSRLHATIELIKNNEESEIVISDNNSKFGSIVLLQTDSLPIFQEPVLSVQFGKNLVSFNIKNKNIVYRCFTCSSKGSVIKNNINYNRINSENINLKKAFTIKEEKLDTSEEEEVQKNEITKGECDDKEEKEDETNRNSDIEEEEDVEIQVINSAEMNMRDKKKKYFSRNKANNSSFIKGKVNKKFKNELGELDTIENNELQQSKEDNRFQTMNIPIKNTFTEDNI